VDTVIVDGTMVFENGRVTAVDETVLLNQFRQQFQRIERNLDLSDPAAAERESSFEEAYRECVSQPMQIHRWADTPVIESRLTQAFAKKDD
jgi:hypothetical protein